MSSEHYFSQDPGSEFKPKRIKVQILGQQVEVETAGGIFSPDRIDKGTSILLNHIDAAPRGGNLLDIGCGWGPIALSLASRAPQATVWAIDVNERSLALTRANAALLGLNNIKACLPEEVPADLVFDGIWSNPPIRVGKDVLHEILLKWLPRLNSGASAYMVVQKNLGSDSLHRWLDEKLPGTIETSRVDTDKAFRVLRSWNRG
jgi:16S rRNA (guanine1207-N2)-methyltransferase